MRWSTMMKQAMNSAGSKTLAATNVYALLDGQDGRRRKIALALRIDMEGKPYLVQDPKAQQVLDNRK